RIVSANATTRHAESLSLLLYPATTCLAVAWLLSAVCRPRLDNAINCMGRLRRFDHDAFDIGQGILNPVTRAS
ncbi:MAG TPA: hypothetical protein VHX39_34040, partial [Acetobacteraceae bacterium]|nr:hypothetical protein [Acetobacteraceae bacterium]